MYRDPDEPTSELYRLMPPRRPRSQLREALDAALTPQDPDQVTAEVPPARRRPALRPAARRILAWLGATVTALVIAVVAGLIVNYLSGTYPPAHGTPATPAANSRP